MKICIVSDLYYPYPGGVSEHVHHTALELRKLGHEVHILTTNYKTHNSLRPLANGPTDTIHNSENVIRIGRGISYRINKSFGVLPIDFRRAIKVRQVMQRPQTTDHKPQNSFDVVHVHAPNCWLSALALKYSRAANILTFHSSAPKLKWHRHLGGIINPYIRRVDGVIPVSNEALRTMQGFIPVQENQNSRLLPTRHRIIPNGIDTERFSPEVEPLPKFKDGGPNILFVGRLEQRKGLKYLIQAFQGMSKKIPTARLIVVGKGAEKLKTQNSKLKTIYFEGFVPAKDVPKYYASCDVFCSPATDRESFGIVLLEAMASGKVVLASNIAGYKEVVNDGEDGLLVEPKNPEALAQKLIEVLTNKELMTRLGKNGRKTALKYSWEKVTKEIESFYYEIANEKNIK
ncbi:glycosyltransferase family 4 protein [candidate division WOR-3 bacterium]|nr:glycosyltransferase family 4 protein [candidate division WOR-3 bacterium]